MPEPRRIAGRSREFWERFCAYPVWWLAETYPKALGGYSRQGWSTNMVDARATFPDLPWPPKPGHGYKPQAPDAPYPEPVYVDELDVPESGQPLTTEQAVERDAEVKRLRARVADLDKKYSSAHDDNDLITRLTEAMDSRIPAMPRIPVTPKLKRHAKGKPESVVALLSDAHIGERVDLEETGGLSHYDFETFTRRYQYHVDGIGGICLGKLMGYDFSELRVVALGDMVSGIIHDELVETSDGTLMDWLIDGSSVIAQGLRQLAAEFPKVAVDWHFGNHGRVTQKPRFKRRWVNYDYLMGHMVSLHLADQRNITFTNHKSFWSLIDVQGRSLLNLHGDNIKGWNGLPVYGINRAIGNLESLLAQRNHRFELVNLAHFHQTGLLERMTCDVMLNGSIIGANEFSIGALFAGAKPRQVMYGVHPDRGQTWVYRLDLSGEEDHECRFVT